MSVINHLISNLVLHCRIIYIIRNFQFLLNTLTDQNSSIKQTETGFLLRSVLQIIASFIAIILSLASIYLLLMFGCVMTDSCYYFYGGV